MEDKLKTILNENEKRGADYKDRKVNNKGIVFDFSGLGYHVKPEKIFKKNE
jgi:hypothetical protein